MKKSIKNFSTSLTKLSLNKIKGGQLGKPYSRPRPKATSCGSGHVTILK